MSVFNSLGTNYSGAMVFRSLLPASPKSPDNLKRQLQKHYAAETVVLTNRGREAIALILKQLNLPKGSLVAMNGYSCYVVYEAIESAGLKPYLLDVDERNLNFSAATLRSAIKSVSDIKAVIIQNTLGMPADVPDIQAMCAKEDIFLIEDLAHSAGLMYANNMEAGTVGDAAALSFSQNKTIDAAAGGAAIFKRGQELRVQQSRVSLPQRFANYWYPLNTFVIRITHASGLGKVLLRALKKIKLLPEPLDGYAGNVRRLPAHQAKLAGMSFAELSATIKHRKAIAKIYQALLPVSIQLPFDPAAVYIRFPLVVTNKVDLNHHLKKNNIHLGIPWYDAVIAPEASMVKTDYISGTCPNGEYFSKHIVNLPTHININEATARLIAEKVNEWLTLPRNQ